MSSDITSETSESNIDSKTASNTASKTGALTAQMDERRKKLYFRSCHRGIKEMDIIFSKFAETALIELSDAELDDYERILELPDTDLFNWSTGRQETPADIRTPLLDRLLSLEHMRK